MQVLLCSLLGCSGVAFCPLWWSVYWLTDSVYAGVALLFYGLIPSALTRFIFLGGGFGGGMGSGGMGHMGTGLGT